MLSRVELNGMFHLDAIYQIVKYNRDIKESFTKRLRHHLKSTIQVFKDVVSYESLNGKDFKTEVQVKKYMRVQAKTIIKNNQLISTSSEHAFL